MDNRSSFREMPSTAKLLTGQPDAMTGPSNAAITLMANATRISDDYPNLLRHLVASIADQTA